MALDKTSSEAHVVYSVLDERERSIQAEASLRSEVTKVSERVSPQVEEANAVAALAREEAYRAKKTVDDIIDTDKGKSIRTIAHEEAKMTAAEIVAGADEKYDTLKEIADYIASDSVNAAQLKNKVTILDETKADKTYVNESLALKADKTALEAEAARAAREELWIRRDLEAETDRAVEVEHRIQNVVQTAYDETKQIAHSARETANTALRSAASVQGLAAEAKSAALKAEEVASEASKVVGSLQGDIVAAQNMAEKAHLKAVLMEGEVNEAKAVANESKEVADAAKRVIEDVRAIAENAEGAVTEAIELANAAKDLGGAAYTMAESAKASAESSSTRVDELSNTCADAWMKANGAEELAEMANSTANAAKETADAAYSPDNPPPTPDMEDYAKKSGVVKLYMDEADPYVGNDLGDLGTTSPRELLAFTATVDVEDDGGNLVRSGDYVYGSVGADGFKVEREWVNPNDASSKHGVYSRLDAGRLDIFRTFFDDSYWMDAEESFSVGTEETPDGRLGIVLRFQGVDGSVGGFASAMTTDSIYANAILGSLNNSERGYDGVSHIEFSQYGDIGYSFYNDVLGVDDYMGVNVQEIIQVAYDYSSRYLHTLDGLEFSDGYSEIRFYEYDWESGIQNDRVIYLSDIYNSIYNSSSGGCICFGDNYHSYDDTGTTAAFGLINSIDNSEWACFGTYGMEAGDDESRRHTMITSDQICTTSYTESGDWQASASIDSLGVIYASANIQTDGWVDAAEGITIGEAVLTQESLQKLLALIAE